MVYNKYFSEANSQKIESFIDGIKRKVSFKSILFVLLTILLSNQTFITDFTPFTFVLFDDPLEPRNSTLSATTSVT